MSNLPWAQIAKHGIALRPSSTQPDSWEYAIPPLSAAWYGPYSTREAARIAALHSLLQLARVDVRAPELPIFSLVIDHHPDNPQEYFTELQHQLLELEMMRAALGVEYAYYIDPVLTQARQHFDRLQSLIADQQL